jgi:hypothetical protein
MRIFTTVFATTFLLATAAFGRDHKELNGTWTLEPTQSNFNGQPTIQTGTVTINERTGDITVSRDFKYEGSDATFFYRDMADSENGATIHSGKEMKSKMKWDHDVLKVITTASGSVTTESYMLNPNGTLTATVDRPGRSPITLVFVRK